MSMMPLLSLIVWSPVVGALILLLLPSHQVKALRAVATAFMAIPLLGVAVALASWAAGAMDGTSLGWVEKVRWMPSLGISYYLGVDGLSLALLALAALIGVVAAIASYGIDHRAKEYFVALLLMQTGVLGVFSAQDLILFYFFWELSLIPMYFIISIWGHGRKEYSAIKFIIYTMVASLIMLVGILALYFLTGARTFAIPELVELGGALPLRWQLWLFVAFFLGFAVKVPVWPLHTWLPDAHVDAPTPGSVVLAAVLLKLGAYGLIRIAFPAFPAAFQHWQGILAVLGVVGIVYGALTALGQRDLKKLIAYSSVSHMGFVLLGFAAATPLAITGAVFQMISHGLIAAMLFLMAGVFLDRFHTRDMQAFSGLYTLMPVGSTFMALAAFANLGLPFLSGFIAEFFTLLGAYPVFPQLVWIAAGALLLTAAFNIYMMQRILMGKPRWEHEGTPDLTPRELTSLVPLAALVVVLGVLPFLAVNLYEGPVLQIMARLGGF